MVIEKPIEAKIKELQSHAIDAAMDGIALLDENGVYYFLNDAHVKAFGYENADELIGKTWEAIYPDYEAERLKSLIFPELIKNKKWRGETLGISKDGVLVNQEISLTTLSDGGLICVCRIIDDRKKMEEELRVFGERLSTVVNSIDNGILLETNDRKVVMVNGKLCDFFEIGAEPSALVGSSCEQALEYVKTLTTKPEKFLKDVNSCIKNGIKVVNDIIQLKSGKYLERDFIPIKIGEKFKGYLWVYKDITPQKELIATMEDKLKSQFELSSMKSSYVRLITHELRNPQAMVLRNINLFNDRWDAQMKDLPEFSSGLQLIQNEIQNMSKIINTLINYENILSDKALLKTEISCKNFISNFLNYHYSIFVHSNKFVISESIGEEKILVDLNLFETALKNLIENALKYSITNTPIEISIGEKRNSSFYIKIKNNTRIGNKVNDKLLGVSFYRGDYNQKEGYGLGLNIAKQIIKNHNGNLKCSSDKTAFVSEINIPFIK
jgi:PAS domain S-box-containing protein